MSQRLLSPAISLLCVSLLLSCSNGGGGGEAPSRTTGTARVSVALTADSTCGLPQGPYSHIFLTVADVRANTSATALPTDSGWVDLTPNLSSKPVQIDLLGGNPLLCSLPSLATSIEIVPATFQQFNVVLLANASASQVTNNACGSAANCVVLASNDSVQPITISGEAQNGILISPAQIAGGSFVVNVNENKTVTLAVNSCASLVTLSNGQVRLSPVMTAGLTGSSSNSITGRVVEGVNLGTLVGGRAVVVLEQKDSTGVDRIVKATALDSSGNFSFCGLPTGNYDVVGIGINGLNVAYGATIAIGVPAGTNLGNFPIFPQSGPNQTAASLSGKVTTASASGAVSADLSLSALQTITVGTSTITFTVPQVAPPATTISLPTEANVACPVGTDCVNYTLVVPVTNAYAGTFLATGFTYSQTTTTVPYVVDVAAFVPGSGGTRNCSPSEIQSANLDVTAGATTNVPVLSFVGCR